MNQQELHKAIGNTDIYVIDQILKQRYLPGQHILDAGCARGRNLNWFYQNDFEIAGIDVNSNFIAEAKELYPNSASEFQIGNLDALPYSELGLITSYAVPFCILPKTKTSLRLCLAN